MFLLEAGSSLVFSYRPHKKKFCRLSNLRCLIITSGYCAWNSKNALVFLQHMFSMFDQLFFFCSFPGNIFLSPVGLFASSDQKLKLSCLCSMLIASPLVFLSRSSYLFFSTEKNLALFSNSCTHTSAPTFDRLDRDLYHLDLEDF